MIVISQSVSSDVVRLTSPELEGLRPQGGVYCDLFVILPQSISDAPPTCELAYVAYLSGYGVYRSVSHTYEDRLNKE